MSRIPHELALIQDVLFAERVRRARKIPLEQRILAGALLFDQKCAVMRGAIQSQFPEFTPERVEQELRRRLSIARRIDDGSIAIAESTDRNE